MLSTKLAIDILLGHQYFLSDIHTVAVLYTVILFPFTSSQNFPLADHTRAYRDAAHVALLECSH